MDADVINKAINEAVEEANALGIHGKETTPFLLAKIKDLTGGDSLASNIQLVYNNAKLAAETAVELSKLAVTTECSATLDWPGVPRPVLPYFQEGFPWKERHSICPQPTTIRSGPSSAPLGPAGPLAAVYQPDHLPEFRPGQVEGPAKGTIARACAAVFRSGHCFYWLLQAAAWGPCSESRSSTIRPCTVLSASGSLGHPGSTGFGASVVPVSGGYLYS